MAIRSFSALDVLQQGNRLARIVVRIAFCLDVAIGAAWLVGSPVRTAGETLKPARFLLDWLPFYSMRGYGIIVVALALLGLLSMTFRTDQVTRNVLVLLAMNWTFFVVLDFVAFFQGHRSSLTAPFTLAFLVLVHTLYPISTHVLNVRRLTPEQKQLLGDHTPSSGESHPLLRRWR